MTDADSGRLSRLEVCYLEDFPLHWERVARQRRVRVARSTIMPIDEIVGRAALIRRSAPPSPKGRRTDFPILDTKGCPST